MKSKLLISLFVIMFLFSGNCHSVIPSIRAVPNVGISHSLVPQTNNTVKDKDPKKKKKKSEEFELGGAQTYVEGLEDYGIDVSEATPDMTKAQLKAKYDEQRILAVQEEQKRNQARVDSINIAESKKPQWKKDQEKDATGDANKDANPSTDHVDPPLSTKISNFVSDNILWFIIIIGVLILIISSIVYFSRTHKTAKHSPTNPPPSTPTIPTQTTNTKTNMKFCSQCGKQIPDNAKFCSVCGERQ